jgi:hypothetical protein
MVGPRWRRNERSRSQNRAVAMAGKTQPSCGVVFVVRGYVPNHFAGLRNISTPRTRTIVALLHYSLIRFNEGDGDDGITRDRGSGVRNWVPGGVWHASLSLSPSPHSAESLIGGPLDMHWPIQRKSSRDRGHWTGYGIYLTAIAVAKGIELFLS